MSAKTNLRMHLMIVLAFAVAVSEDTNADYTFGEATNLGSAVNTSSRDGLACCSADGLSLYFSSQRSDGHGGWDLWVAERSTTNDPWAAPVNLGPTVNTASWELGPNLSADGLTLLFQSDRSNGQGAQDFWAVTRATTTAPWGPPVNLGAPVNSSGNEVGPSHSADGTTLFFSSDRSGGYGGDDLYMATRPSVSDAWDTVVNLGETVNTSSTDRAPSLSADGRLLFFHSDRSGGSGSYDIWVTTRTSDSDPWKEPVNLGPAVNSSVEDVGPTISADGRTLFLTSMRSGGSGQFDVWQVSIDPIVDLNADGAVDGSEVMIMADAWGTDESLCDIGPMPWGDGIVDVRDLRILAAHIGQPVVDSSLIAHWAFDETAGDIAADSAGAHDGAVTGAALWHPEAGQVDGALELDGTTVVVTDHFLDPANGPFSVLAWIKGGTPGQVIISQDLGSDWLAIDAESGGLMTAVAPPKSRQAVGPLVTQAVVADGLWHRIALVWDGAGRSLHVDGALVGVDEHNSLVARMGGLNIGCGSDMASGTFFTGLIDDVRVYNRVVQP